MDDREWIVVDTETTGINNPVFVVELAAQRMRGWERKGAGFRVLINQNAEIPPEASRVHGYTRQILERDGISALDAYEKFSQYVDGLPLCAYNLQFDLDRVLIPEWSRLGIKEIGLRGFCIYRLAQKLLDPVPAGNCKLQTLRQYYRLPERGAHTAMGDVDTAIDLATKVLLPLIDREDLNDWGTLITFIDQEWHPSRISFGKFKGRYFWEADADEELRDWLEWLSNSSSGRASQAATWYLKKLDGLDSSSISNTISSKGRFNDNPSKQQLSDLVSRDIALSEYSDSYWQPLVDASKVRLAEVERQFIEAKEISERVSRRIYRGVRDHSLRRDQLWQLVQHRTKILTALMELASISELEKARDEHQESSKRLDDEYSNLNRQLESADRLSPEQAVELKSLWRGLVRYFHPDVNSSEGADGDQLNSMMAVINKAREECDLNLLREISSDPDGYFAKMHLSSQIGSRAHSRATYENLQFEIVQALEELQQLRSSTEYQLALRLHENPEELDQVVQRRIAFLEEETVKLEEQASSLKYQIEKIGGATVSIG